MKKWIYGVGAIVIVAAVGVIVWMNKPDVYTVELGKDVPEVFIIEYNAEFNNEDIMVSVLKNEEEFKEFTLEYPEVATTLVNKNLTPEQLTSYLEQEDKIEWIKDNLVENIVTADIPTTITNDKEEVVEIGVLQVKYIILDTIKPEITGVSEVSYFVDESFDLNTVITAKDPVDGDLEVLFSEYEKTIGVHTVMATAKDKHDNESTYEVTVTIKERPVVAIPKPVSKPNKNNNNTSGSGSNAGSYDDDEQSASTKEVTTLNIQLDHGVVYFVKRL